MTDMFQELRDSVEKAQSSVEQQQSTIERLSQELHAEHRKWLVNEEQAIEKAREELQVDDVTVDFSDGHSGPGWYAWDTEYPEEGSTFLGPA